MGGAGPITVLNIWAIRAPNPITARIAYRLRRFGLRRGRVAAIVLMSDTCPLSRFSGPNLGQSTSAMVSTLRVS